MRVFHAAYLNPGDAGDAPRSVAYLTSVILARPLIFDG